MAHSNRNDRRPARHLCKPWALAWGLLFFGTAQFFLMWALEGPWIELRDPEFAFRLKRLREAQAKDSDRPLVLVLGSSRSSAGFRPASLQSCRLQDGRQPLVSQSRSCSPGSACGMREFVPTMS